MSCSFTKKVESSEKSPLSKTCEVGVNLGHTRKDGATYQNELRAIRIIIGGLEGVRNTGREVP